MLRPVRSFRNIRDFGKTADWLCVYIAPGIKAVPKYAFEESMVKRLFLVALVAGFSAGCVKEKSVDQSSICIYSNDEEAKECTPGELSWFNPSSWGNSQLPLSVAAAYCDFNYEVMYNESGVICTFTNERQYLLE